MIFHANLWYFIKIHDISSKSTCTETWDFLEGFGAVLGRFWSQYDDKSGQMLCCVTLKVCSVAQQQVTAHCSIYLNIYAAYFNHPLSYFVDFYRFVNEYHWILNENLWYFMKIHDISSKSMRFHQNPWDFIKIQLCRKGGLSGRFRGSFWLVFGPNMPTIGSYTLLYDIWWCWKWDNLLCNTLLHTRAHICGTLRHISTVCCHMLRNCVDCLMNLAGS